jgi:RHS repeat-associated protein
VLAEQTRVTDDARSRAEKVVRTSTWEYEPGGFRPVAQIDGVRPRDAPQEWIDQRFYAIVTDLVGSPTELVEPTEGIVWRSRTTVWGAAPGGRDDDELCPLRFPGQYHDAETGLTYNLLRYYDPENARYRSPDPLGIAPQPNPYSYVLNPTALVDPLGLAPMAGQSKYVKVYRFGDRSNPQELISNLEKHGTPEQRANIERLMKDPDFAEHRAEQHAAGYTDLSPYISVAGSPHRAFNTTDPWLGEITSRTPDLGVFEVPRDRLTALDNELSISETELLFHGGDLGDHLVKWIPNPYRVR